MSIIGVKDHFQMNSLLTLLLLCTNLKKIHVNNHKNLCHQMYCLKFGSKCQIPLFRNLKEVGFKRKRKLKRKFFLDLVFFIFYTNTTHFAFSFFFFEIFSLCLLKTTKKKKKKEIKMVIVMWEEREMIKKMMNFFIIIMKCNIK